MHGREDRAVAGLRRTNAADLGNVGAHVSHGPNPSSSLKKGPRSKPKGSALAACGGGPSEAEIEATVQARLNEERAADAAVEARVELAKAAPTIPAATSQRNGVLFRPTGPVEGPDRRRQRWQTTDR